MPPDALRITGRGELAARLGPVLARRGAELQRLLDARFAAACDAADPADAVTDTKERAASVSEALIGEAAAELATRELEQVTAARHRIADGSFGLCEQCGNAIDAGRLAALPSAALCAACQSAQERQQQTRQRRRILRLAKRGA